MRDCPGEDEEEEEEERCELRTHVFPQENVDGKSPTIVFLGHDRVCVCERERWSKQFWVDSVSLPKKSSSSSTTTTNFFLMFFSFSWTSSIPGGGFAQKLRNGRHLPNELEHFSPPSPAIPNLSLLPICRADAAAAAAAATCVFRPRWAKAEVVECFSQT